MHVLVCVFLIETVAIKQDSIRAWPKKKEKKLVVGESKIYVTKAIQEQREQETSA